MSTQHTPGPWTSTELASAIVPGFAYGVGHDPLGPSDVAWPIALVVTPDDARLIAAAPKLLETLEGVRRIVANQLDNALFPSKGNASKLTVEQAHVRERLGMASRMAHNAIAEAKGELRK